jgi:hypothetical protein
MKIDDYENNCGPTAFHQILPDRSERAILKACFKAGFHPDVGMLPNHIHEAANLLGLKWESISLRTLKPSHGAGGDMRNNITLSQALIALSDAVCIIRVNAHVLASNRGLSLDPNIARRGSRRRVLEIMMIHNATIAEHRPGIAFDDPKIRFLRDIRDETQHKSYRRQVYERVVNIVSANDTVKFSDLRPCGYTKKMLKRHHSRGDVFILD